MNIFKNWKIQRRPVDEDVSTDCRETARGRNTVQLIGSDERCYEKLLMWGVGITAIIAFAFASADLHYRDLTIVVLYFFIILMVANVVALGTIIVVAILSLCVACLG